MQYEMLNGVVAVALGSEECGLESRSKKYVSHESTS